MSGIIGAAQELGGKLLTSLPSQFLALVLMTLVFNLGMLWFLDRQNTARERVLQPILASCMNDVPIAVMHEMLQQLEKRP